MRFVLLVCFIAACGKAPIPGRTSAQAKVMRAACAFDAGAKTFDTLGNDVPLAEKMPFDHVVLLMQENRSFDHYFSKLPGVRAAPNDASNPDLDGGTHPRQHGAQYCLSDPDHSWEGSLRQWNNGQNDGFVISNSTDGQDGARAMDFYDADDIPFYYGLASTFAISDNHFAALLGPTQPNRMYLWAATSFGEVANALPPQKVHGRPTVTIFSRLNDAKISWKIYTTNLATPAVFVDLLTQNLGKFRPIDEFFTDAAAGTLPTVSVVESQYVDGDESHVPTESDEHAHSNIQRGQAFTAKVINATLNGPSWPTSVLFLTYDEHGGFYDSVPPPPACPPDDMEPRDQPADVHFDRYGFRVPLIAVSPFVKRGYVSHEVSDHTSIDRFIEARFDLPSMTARDANADALLDMFDFAHPDTSMPTLPEAVIDPAHDAECNLLFPP